MYDAMMLLFDIGLSPRFKYASVVQQNREQAITQLEEATARIANSHSKNKTALENLERSKAVFRKELEDNIRQGCWSLARLFEKVRLSSFFSPFLSTNCSLSFCLSPSRTS